MGDMRELATDKFCCDKIFRGPGSAVFELRFKNMPPPFNSPTREKQFSRYVSQIQKNTLRVFFCIWET